MAVKARTLARRKGIPDFEIQKADADDSKQIYAVLTIL